MKNFFTIFSYRWNVVVLLLTMIMVPSCNNIKKIGFSLRDAASKGVGSFQGIQSIQLSSEGKYILLWDHPQDVDLSAITYEIYMDKWTEETPIPSNGLSNDYQENLPGSILSELEKEKTPASKGKLISQVKGVRSFTLSERLRKATNYVFQVRAVDDKGNKDSNKRVLFYNPDSRFYFPGLFLDNVTLASDNSKISLSWSPATGAIGNVKYVVFSDANFANSLSTQTSTTYEFRNPVLGQVYTFAVRAYDDETPDDNKRFVTVSIPDPSDKTPPVFAGLVSAAVASDKKILLKWTPSPSTDVAQYNIYFAHNLTSAVASTSESSIMMGSLVPASNYSFVVRARDASGNEDKNLIQRSAQTLSYTVPDFAGLQTVSPVAGVAGLDTLTLSWPIGTGSTHGYWIYRSETSGVFDFNSPIATITGAATDTYTATGLSADTTYYFVVRAFDAATPAKFELNTLERTGRTLRVQAPTFAGVSTAVAGPGSLALSQAITTWPSPSIDGVYNGFVVQYEAGTCAAGFSGAPLEQLVPGDTVRTATINGLTASTNYRFRVRTRFSTGNIRDTNTQCLQVFTEPAAPTFAGINNLTIPTGAAGLTQAIATWAPASGSFSYYSVEWSTSSTFATFTVEPNITNIATTTRTITGLPAKTTIYVRVKAVFDESGTVLTTGANVSRSVDTTPVAPTGEGPSSVQIMSADSLKLNWTAPTNVASFPLYNQFRMWSFCGASAPAGLTAKLNGAPDATYPTNQLSQTFSGLSSNVECCYQVRAHYDDGTNTMASTSTVNYQCRTPTLTAPTFAGVTTVVNPNTGSGFSSLNVNWTPVDSSEAGLFSYYEIDFATTPGGVDWAGTTTVATRASTGTTITGLADNTTYFVKVRAVNANGSPVVHAGGDAVASATTTPARPTGDGLSAASSISSTKALLNYTPPSSTLATGGLFNQIFMFVQAGNTADVATLRTSIETGGVTNAEIQGVTSSKRITLSSVPAVFRIPYPSAEVTNNVQNDYEVWGLTANQQVCFQAVAVYWVDGQPSRYLTSTTPTTRCVTPTAGPPIFAGVSTLTGFGDVRDFTQIIANFSAPTGDCTAIEALVSTSPSATDWTTPSATGGCGVTSLTIGGLSPHTDYYVQVRAVNEVSGVKYAAGQGTELLRKTVPPAPSGDGITGATITPVALATDTAALTWTNPSSGLWSHTYVWRALGSTLSAAQAAVRAAAATNGGRTGPVTAPTLTYTSGSNTTSVTDTGVTAGEYICYLVKGVYSDGSYYNASLNDTVQCDISPFTTPSFGGVVSGVVDGIVWDSTASIELTFSAPPSGSIEEYWVYRSPDNTLAGFGDLTAKPWQVVPRGDVNFDLNPNDNKIKIGGIGNTVAGDGYYLVRWKFYGGPSGVSDTNTSISSVVTVPESQSNLVYVAPARSGLSYGFYIMQYEASTGGGTYSGDSASDSDSSMQSCNYEFHQNKVAKHASCGTLPSTASVYSGPNRTPIHSATWDQAFTACRNTSSQNMLVRLPTMEEWTRAGKWAGVNYNTMWSAISGTAAGQCLNGSFANTRAKTQCKNDLHIYEMAGNLSEWVDSRMKRYSVDDPLGNGTSVGFDADSERRFGFGPTIGVNISNGIDNVIRRFHQMNPGATPLGLAMGANFDMSVGDQKIYGHDSQTWLSRSTSSNLVGFRCVAFPVAKVPTQAQLALPQEPVYTAADYSGAPSTWTIPENMYVKDNKVELMHHILATHPHYGGPFYPSVWDFNHASAPTGSITDFGTDQNSRPLSITSGVTFSQGPYPENGRTAFNTPTGTVTNGDRIFFSNHPDFDQTTTTVGGWFYMSNWAHGSGDWKHMIGKQDGVTGFALQVEQTGRIRFVVQGVFDYYSTAVSPGWHFIVASLQQGGNCNLYIDGTLSGGFSCPTNVDAPSVPLAVMGQQLGQPSGLSIARAFAVPGTAYNATQVKDAYHRQLHNHKFSHPNSLYDNMYSSMTMHWSPWTKTVCNPTCTTSSMTGNYHLYRFREPTRIAERTPMPWALTGGSPNPYPSDMPLDPLAVDTSNNRIYTTAGVNHARLVMTRPTTNCHSGDTSGCGHGEGEVGNVDAYGFYEKRLYRYMLVAQDAEGNSQLPMSQRMRTAYLAGPAQAAAADYSFRLEPRYRSIGMFLVDEMYQESLARPQVMTYVPMEKSGLDHDFFIQKYEASSYSGAVVNNSPAGSAEWPLQADGSGGWRADAGKCYDNMNQTGSFHATCGNGTVVNGTTTTVQSKQNTSPLVSLDQGAMWKACRNTGFNDYDGNTYYLSLPSDPEWMKAADWGDLNQDGVIDIGMNTGVTISNLESGAADSTTVRCHTDGNPWSAYNTNSTQTTSCRSRYGTADMVGNVWELTTGQIRDGVGYDNGLDGSWLARSLPSSTNTVLGIGGRYDLFRGFPLASGAVQVAGNGDHYFYLGGLRSSFRGGDWNGNYDNGRWSLAVVSSPSIADTYLGGRCRR